MNQSNYNKKTTKTKKRFTAKSFTPLKRQEIRIEGIVQGVGFRPFVFRLANEYLLHGYVLNDAHGVVIEVEGEDGRIEEFTTALREKAPPMSRIVRISSQKLDPYGYTLFEIRKSQNENERSALISPDIAVCNDCLTELFEPTNRRFRYPFINCTNCGPRFTITNGIPYDRPNTSMSKFIMCPDCQREYDDPTNRRFHAQPNACPACGPKVTLIDEKGEVVICGDPISKTVELLHQGRIVAIKGLGGFHLAVDAMNDSSVIRLRQRKHREEKPLAIMVPDITTAKQFVQINRVEKELLESPERPIVLLTKKNYCPVAESVAPNNAFLGIMLPYTPLHYLLIREEFSALVMTSGNLSEEPIAIDNNEAFHRLAGIADYFLVYDRDILLRSDDSVVRILGNSSLPIRRSRGFVPVPVLLEHDVPQILACGGELKNTVCLTKGRHAFVSQHIGDLENMETLGFFEECIDHLQNILQINPSVIVHDLHPRYLSTQWAKSQTDVKLVGVQHHHAHIAACLAENGVSGPVIGLALDGTGYGTDGNVWGGEALIADTKGFTRAAHFEYIPMPGGEKAIKEPWRMALSYLHHTFGQDFWQLPIEFVKKLDKDSTSLVLHATQKRINTPLTSSLGRLFDGIAALLAIHGKVAFEGQAAMELEMAMYGQASTPANDDIAVSTYNFPVEERDDVLQVLIGEVIEHIVHDIIDGLPIPTISHRFHHSLVCHFVEICRKLRERTGINTVAMSGGCFQNRYLSLLLPKRLQENGFQVLTHSIVPPNDGGLALGQAVVAAAVVED